MVSRSHLCVAGTGCGAVSADVLLAFVLGERLDSDVECGIQAHVDECRECMHDTEQLFQSAACLWNPDRTNIDWDHFAKRTRDRLRVESWREEGGTVSTVVSEAPVPTEENVSPERRRLSPELYALEQTLQDCDQKDLVAEWAVEFLNLPHGSAAFFDAGSSCLSVFQKYLSRRSSRLVNVTTNSFLILQEWINNPSAGQLLARGFTVDSVGENLDTPHLAFYGKGIQDKLLSGTFRPSVVFIGTNGFGFEDGKLLFGFHAPPEAAAKAVLFQCPSRIKVILTTARKIGNVSGSVLDLLTIPVYEKGNWYLATTVPCSEEKDAYDRTLKEFRKNGAQCLMTKGINFHWLEIARNSTGAIVARDRMEEDPTVALVEAEAMTRRG